MATEETPVQNGPSPYELRFNLLHLAKDILETNAHMAREDNVGIGSERKTYYDIEEVIETAKQLNNFVSNNK